MFKQSLSLIAQRSLPGLLYHWLAICCHTSNQQAAERSPDFGGLRRLAPVSRKFGYDRGLPIDRFYIENFLARQADDIYGHVLEIGDDSYTRRFGGERVTTVDVLHIDAGIPDVTIIGDLVHADHIPSNTFNCIVLTQTLQFIYDVQAAIKTLYRVLKPGGVVLTTFPGISQIAGDEWGDYQYWSFNTLSAQRLFEEVFPAAHVKVETFGNILAAVAFLQGLAAEELNLDELTYQDDTYQLLITVRAMKPERTE